MRNTYDVDKRGWSIYYKAVSPTDCLESIDYQFCPLLGFFLRAVGSGLQQRNK
jgi:hypothetical protein